jgi:ferredoxin--NADP+ reductase
MLSTSDGSAGTEGKLAGVLEKLEKEGIRADLYYLMGCTFMMMNGSRMTPDGAKTLVALNALMVDGTGMCGCCRVSVGGETKFVCVDGPEFDGKKVDWDEASRRASVYQREEVLAYHSHTCRAHRKEVIG